MPSIGMRACTHVPSSSILPVRLNLAAHRVMLDITLANGQSSAGHGRCRIHAWHVYLLISHPFSRVQGAPCPERSSASMPPCPVWSLRACSAQLMAQDESMTQRGRKNWLKLRSVYSTSARLSTL
jgi:hypothetical protein